MMIDRDIFFAKVRAQPFNGSMKQEQVDGCNTILDQWEKRTPTGDRRWLAYMLATPFWETNHTMQPVREAYYLGEDSGRAEAFRKTLRYYPFYGRGLVQLTWEFNYAKQSKKLGIDLVSNPDRVLEPEIAVEIMFSGMRDGDFTGVGLPHYFNDLRDDPLNARRVINAMDHAEDIAAIHASFLSGIVERVS